MAEPMQYFLNISGRAEGPFELAEIRDSLRAGEIEPETLAARADGSNQWVPLATLLELPVPEKASAPAAPPPLAPPEPEASAPAAPATAMPALSPREYLQMVRANSCYGFLRAVIDVGFVVVLLMVGVLALVATLGGAVAGITRGNNAVLAGLGIVYFCVTLLVLLTLRKAAQLVVDVADTLLHEHARKARR